MLILYLRHENEKKKEELNKIHRIGKITLTFIKLECLIPH